MASNLGLRQLLQATCSATRGLLHARASPLHARASTRRLLSSSHPLMSGSQDGGNSGGGGSEEEEEKLKGNPYFDKYEEKIKKVKDTKQPAKRKTIKTDKRLRQEMEKWKRYQDMLEGKFSAASKEADARDSKMPNSLNDLMKLELLLGKTAEEIGNFWTEYFKSQENTVYAVIPGDTWRTMKRLSEESRTFLYPLPKEKGYEFIMSTWHGNRCFFTSLINWHAHGDAAPWQMCLTHYPDLLESHNIVLMTSELDTKTLNIVEGRFVSLLAQKFYSREDNNYTLVYRFNHDPQNFDFMEIVKAVDESNMTAKEASPLPAAEPP